MNTKEQWEYEFDKLFVEQGNHRGGKVVREEASKIFDFIRETREQVKKEERERITEKWESLNLRGNNLARIDNELTKFTIWLDNLSN